MNYIQYNGTKTQYVSTKILFEGNMRSYLF